MRIVKDMDEVGGYGSKCYFCRNVNYRQAIPTQFFFGLDFDTKSNESIKQVSLSIWDTNY